MGGLGWELYLYNQHGYDHVWLHLTTLLQRSLFLISPRALPYEGDLNVNRRTHVGTYKFGLRTA